MKKVQVIERKERILFDEKEKARIRETQFPKDLEKAFDLGKKLVEMPE